MRIAIHAGTLRGKGSAQVGRTVIEALSDLHAGRPLLVWHPKSWGRLELPEPNSTAVTTRAGAIAKAWLETAAIPRLLERWGADCLLTLGDTAVPLAPVPQVLLVQQAYLSRKPSEHGFDLPIRSRVRHELMAAYFRIGVKSVSHFIVQSEYMRDRLADRWRLARGSIAVVPTPVTPPRAAGIRRSERTLCYIAGPGPHKNLAVLPRVVERLRRSGDTVTCRLTVRETDAPRVAREARRLGVRSLFDFIGPVTKGELATVFGEATIAVIPSLLESFGMTFYEAMALGCPVVASDLEFAHEACGEAALYVSPDDDAAWTKAIRRLLHDHKFRDDLARRGVERWTALDLSPRSVAEKLFAVLREAARNTADRS